MVYRPNIFNRAVIAAEIETLGYPAKTASWAADWLKLAAPMAFKELGADQLAEIVTQGSWALGLKPLPKMTPTLAQALTAWSEVALERYQSERTTLPGTAPDTEAEPI